MKNIILGLAFLLVLGGFSMFFGAPSWAAGAGVTEIDAQALDTLLKSPTPPVLLDVREPDEVAQGHIQGAVTIPLGQLPARLGELSKDKPIVVYCHSGRRSAMAASLLVQNGFTKVENLKGGIVAWLRDHACDPATKAC